VSAEVTQAIWETRQELERLRAYYKTNAEWIRDSHNELKETKLGLDRLQEVLTRQLGETRHDFTQLEELVSDYRRASDITARQLEKLQAQVDAPAKIAKDYDRLLEQLEKRCYHAEILGANAIKTSDETAATSAREIAALKEELGSLRAELDAQWRAASPRKSALELVLEFAYKSPELIKCLGFYFLLVWTIVAVSVVNIVTAPKPAKFGQVEAKAY
jgi:chromosome segregation ATPase